MSQHRHLYNSARWKRLRVEQLSREPLCAMHEQLGRVVGASVVDHKRPHRGNEDLFFDAGNLQSLCKQCHDAHKQAQEHNADGLLRGAGLDGRPLDAAHPWHQAVRGGGEEKSATLQPKTGTVPSFAECHNSEGGA